MTAMLDRLSKDDRLLLLKFVCAFAWADLEVKDSERKFIMRLVKKLELDADEAARVEQWLHVAPAPQSVNPELVPQEHKRAFVEAVRAMMYADGEVDPDEREGFDKLKSALGL